MRVNYETYFGKQQYTQLPQYVDSWTYAEMLNEARSNEGLGAAFTQADIDKYRSGTSEDYPNTNHLKNIFTSGNGFQTRHNLSVNGTQDNTSYLFSVGYLKQNGIIDKINYDRYDYRLNLTSKVRDNLSLSAKLSGNFSTRNEPAMLYEGSLGGLNAILRSATVPAIIPGRLSDGTYGTYMGHPVSEAGLDSKSFVQTKNNFIMNIFAFEWDIFKIFKIHNPISIRSELQQK